MRLQRLSQIGAQLVDTLAHGDQFCAPDLPQAVIGKNTASQQSTVGRRHGVDAPRRRLGLSQNSLGVDLILANKNSGSGALAIKAQVFGAGRRYQHFRQPRHQQAQARCILIEAVAQPLVGYIDKRDKALLLGHVGNHAPLL